MKPFTAASRLDRYPYHLRFMLALLVVEFSVLLFIRYWPSDAIVAPSSMFRATDKAAAVTELVTITRQSPSTPAPIKPYVTAEEPRDVILPDELELADAQPLDLPRSIVPPATGETAEGSIAMRPQRPPTPSRIVEPEKERFRRHSDRGLEIRVRFLVDERGEVERAEIESITIYMDDGTAGEMDTLPGELERDVLAAARQWRFRPAMLDGAPVRAYAEGIFRF